MGKDDLKAPDHQDKARFDFKGVIRTNLVEETYVSGNTKTYGYGLDCFSLSYISLNKTVHPRCRIKSDNRSVISMHMLETYTIVTYMN